MPDNNNNKNKASRNKTKNGVKRKAEVNDKTTSATQNGDKNQNVTSSSGTVTSTSAPPPKRQKTVNFNGNTDSTDDKVIAPETSERKTAVASKKRSGVSKKNTATNEVISRVHPSQPGFVLAMGDGDTGQLGLGPDILDRSKPARVDLPADAIHICAGGMHSVCLTVKGEVYTFGCNDEGALGRKVDDEEECMTPGKVDVPEKVVLVSAGDSHTVALTANGHVYIWGTFRDANGPIGILPGKGKLEKPTQIMKEHFVIKIASGSDHLACLTNKGILYTLDLLLNPNIVRCKSRHVKFCDVWTGQYCTFAKAKDTSDIYAWGLNNYYQLGIADMQNKFIPEKVASFEKNKNWATISVGQHHTVALDSDGKVYSLGRKEYGRLGLGKNGLEEKSKPTIIPKLRSKKCVHVSCGTAVSYAVDSDGTVYSWGMGSAQLGQGESEEDSHEPVIITSKQLHNQKCLMTSAGGQHTLLLARERF